MVKKRAEKPVVPKNSGQSKSNRTPTPRQIKLVQTQLLKDSESDTIKIAATQTAAVLGRLFFYGQSGSG